MNIQLLKDWSKALKSGKYTQTVGRLKRGECFCAYGVLLDISKKGQWVDPCDDNLTAYYIDNNPICPDPKRHDTSKVFETSNEKDIRIAYITDVLVREVVFRNDRGIPFKEIASHIDDFIKTNLKEA